MQINKPVQRRHVLYDMFKEDLLRGTGIFSPAAFFIDTKGSKNTMSNISSGVELFLRAVRMDKRASATRRVWITSTGESYPVTRMDNAHLFNTIKFLRKQAKLKLPYLSDLQAVDDFIADHVITYPAMLEEVANRGLKVPEDVHLFGNKPVVTAQAQTDIATALSLYKSVITRVTNLEAAVARLEEAALAKEYVKDFKKYEQARFKLAARKTSARKKKTTSRKK